MTTLTSPSLPNLDSLWQLLERTTLEFDRRSVESKAEADHRAAETARMLAESKAETDRLFAESKAEADRRSAEADRRAAEADHRAAEADHRAAETARMLAESKAETDKAFREMAAESKKLSKQMGDLGNRLGEFVEHMVAPAVVRLFQERGIDVHEVHQNIEIKRGEEAMEIDLFVVNDGDLVVVECKSKLTFEHVDNHVIRMKKLKRLMPAYRHHRALGAVAAMVITPDVRKYAHDNGFFVLYQNGETVEIGTQEGFSPKAW